MGIFSIRWFPWLTPEPNASNVFFDALIKFAWGFVPALCLGYLVAIVLQPSARSSAKALPKTSAALLFACGTWSIILSAILDLNTGRGWDHAALDYARIFLVIPILLAPVSFVVGIPAFVVCAWKMRDLGSRTVFYLVSALLVTSYLYLVGFLSIDWSSQ
jgi:hypothetical protein